MSAMSFVRCLDGLMRSGRVFVVATMRSDYWHRAAEVPRLAELSDGNGRFDLLPPTQAEIAEMIRRPAEASGLAFETDRRTDIRLDAALAEEAAHEPGALPLVSFLLDALFLLDVKEAGRSTLGYASMQALGGLKGAIATRAEAAFAALSEDAQAALPKVLRALARVSRSGADPTARIAPMARFAAGGPERKIIDALLAPDVRLLVAEGDGQGARIRFAHEALISHWGRAKQQIAQDRDDLRTLTAIEEAEAEWRAADARHKRGYLLHDVKLANAVDLARRWADDLPGEVRGFVARSAAAAAAAARRRWAAAAVVMFLLAALAAASLAGFYIAEIQRNDALIAESHSLARDARAATASGDATLATLLALAALPRDLAKPDRPFVNEAEYALEEAVANQRERVVLPARERRILTARFAPDGTAQAVVSRIDHAVELWNASTGAPIVVFLGHADGINSATFSSDGMRLLTTSRDHTARLWDVETGAQITVFRGHDDAVEQASFSPDGMQVITASRDQTARIWKSDSGAMVAVLRGHEYRLSVGGLFARRHARGDRGHRECSPVGCGDRRSNRRARRVPQPHRVLAGRRARRAFHPSGRKPAGRTDGRKAGCARRAHELRGDDRLFARWDAARNGRTRRHRAVVGRRDGRRRRRAAWAQGQPPVGGLFLRRQHGCHHVERRLGEAVGCQDRRRDRNPARA